MHSIGIEKDRGKDSFRDQTHWLENFNDPESPRETPREQTSSTKSSTQPENTFTSETPRIVTTNKSPNKQPETTEIHNEHSSGSDRHRMIDDWKPKRQSSGKTIAPAKE